MKSLSLTKPLVLVIIGLPGAGKSFFARQFSETFNAPVVSIDRIQHSLKTIEKNQTPIARQLAALQTEELFKTQKTFIVDGLGMSRAARADIRKTATTAGYGVLLIWVQTDPATAKYRSLKRSARRKDDQYNTSLTSEEYERRAKAFTSPLENEPSVVVSGKHTYATQARIVLKKFATPRGTTPPIQGHEGRTPTVVTDTPASSPRRSFLIR